MDAHTVDISIFSDVPSNETRHGATKVCGGAPCGFSNAQTSSREANERSASMWKLWGGVILCFVFMGVEVFGGIKANSLAILTDAAHLLSDVAAFAISLFAVWASGWEATPRQSYGFFRVEILGTLVSIQIIWLITGILVYEAIDRLVNGTVEIEGGLMFGIASFGLVVNILMMFILGHDHGHAHGDHQHDHGVSVTTHQHHHHGHADNHHQHDHGGHDHNHDHDHDDGVSVTTHQHHHHGYADDHEHDHEEHSQPLLKTYSKDESKEKKRGNINVQGAYLHVLGDSIQSIGVMIGAAVIWYNPKLKIIDPICTLLFSIIVLYTTINMLRDILEVLMESTPREIDATSLERGLCEIDEVVAIHELHIWAITVGKVLLACHVRIRPEAVADLVLDKVVGYINREYNISHVTIQIERE
ncbi:metal tolerance protein 1-like [Bidens hawaiensis]|uniref:metal tolerance protein 1-like n=1 Tax=Bidens hawaiensis TaxID=980011 RepID=UPI00404A6154